MKKIWTVFWQSIKQEYIKKRDLTILFVTSPLYWITAIIAGIFCAFLEVHGYLSVPVLLAVYMSATIFLLYKLKYSKQT